MTDHFIRGDLCSSWKAFWHCLKMDFGPSKMVYGGTTIAFDENIPGFFSLQNHHFSSSEERKSYVSWMVSGWVNNQEIFGWTIPLKSEVFRFVGCFPTEAAYLMRLKWTFTIFPKCIFLWMIYALLLFFFVTYLSLVMYAKLQSFN